MPGDDSNHTLFETDPNAPVGAAGFVPPNKLLPPNAFGAVVGWPKADVVFPVFVFPNAEPPVPPPKVDAPPPNAPNPVPAGFAPNVEAPVFPNAPRTSH